MGSYQVAKQLLPESVMTTTTRKYYVMILSAVSHSGDPYWQKLLEVKSLTSAQSYVDHFFGGITEAEIWVSINDGGRTLKSKKNKEGKWEVVCDGESDDSNPYANNQKQYSRNGPCSEEEFYNGFKK